MKIDRFAFLRPLWKVRTGLGFLLVLTEFR